jgi:osmotically-inducible protein OsmY
MTIRFVQKTALVLVTVLTASTLASCMSARKCDSTSCEADARITANLDAWLYDNKAIQPFTVTVQTIDGTVYLYGIVDTQLQKNIIEDQAGKTPGVKKVVNSISVRGNVW